MWNLTIEAKIQIRNLSMQFGIRLKGVMRMTLSTLILATLVIHGWNGS